MKYKLTVQKLEVNMTGIKLVKNFKNFPKKFLLKRYS